MRDRRAMTVTGQDAPASSSPSTRSSSQLSSFSPSRSVVTAAGNGALLLVDAERAIAFQEARRKFAMYGKQNAHVSHLTSCRKTAAVAREGGGGGNTNDTTVKPMRKRAMLVAALGGDDDATVLKNTLLLQENGELALHLDDLNYRLDGVFANCGLDNDTSSTCTPEQLRAGTQNVVELARLLQLEQVQLVLKLASPSQNLYARIRKVMDLLLRPAAIIDADNKQEDPLQLAVAVMALFLTQGADADEFFTSDTLDLIMQCLEKSVNGEDATRESLATKCSFVEETAKAVALKRGQLMPLKKTCLKRKAGPLKRARSSSVSSGDDAGEPQVVDGASIGHDDQIFAQINSMLDNQEAFCVDGRVMKNVTTTDVLVVVLHNLLQMDKSQEQQHLQTDRSVYPRGQCDFAGAMFSTVLARKRQLVNNQGLDALLLSLVKRFQHLKASLLSAEGLRSAAAFPELEQACSLRRAQAVLRVLDQASFLATEVQQSLSSKAVLFEILLESIDKLSELCWGSRQASRIWSSSSATSVQHHLVAEVFLVSMRVLINLTHHNKDAARQIHSHNGTKVLFRAFCKLWGFVEASKRSSLELKPSTNPDTSVTGVFEEKLLFDALLMCLSALTNCVEFSGENQESLSRLAAPSDGITGLQAFKAFDVCELLTHFFLSKVQSYLRLIDMSESQSGSSQAASIESGESLQWVPEDVVLGGCTSLLLGCLMKDSASASSAVLAILPDGSPRLLLRALSAFIALHSQLGALTPEVGHSVLQVEQTLKSFLSEQESGYSARTPERATVSSSMLKVTISVESVDRSQGGQQLSSQDAVAALPRTEERGVTTPPAAAFKLQRWKKVCAVDSDSECGDGDTALTPSDKLVLPSRSPNARSPKKLKARSPVIRSPSVKRVKHERVNGKARLTRPPAASPLVASTTRPTRSDGANQVQASPQRVKRTRELVSELTTKLSKVSDETSSFSEFSAVLTSVVTSSKQQRGDDEWDLDFSKDHQRPPRTKTGTATPPIRILSRDSSPMTPGARKRARIGKSPHRSPNRPKLAVALTGVSLSQQATLEELSAVPKRVRSTTETSLERESSSENALKRTRKAAKPPPQATSTTDAAAVFDFFD